MCTYTYGENSCGHLQSEPSWEKCSKYSRYRKACDGRITKETEKRPGKCPKCEYADGINQLFRQATKNITFYEEEAEKAKDKAKSAQEYFERVANEAQRAEKAATDARNSVPEAETLLENAKAEAAHVKAKQRSAAEDVNRATEETRRLTEDINRVTEEVKRAKQYMASSNAKAAAASSSRKGKRGKKEEREEKPRVKYSSGGLGDQAGRTHQGSGTRA
ncbi:hypothetical protein QBC37DRAFT_451000 [Rhypophila decipiens]|uniref:Uncharacterized protein n=1 Tax=Rhypophila decipiens TaxID=261697 RepID=A0AAN7BBH7_9PEZI|nr:hypothetical protein QBC37DRAFT_451000 [Rhypophila decipiens]